MTTRKFAHYSHVPKGYWRWPHFTPREMACHHCGELVVHEETMDAAERMRRQTREPAVINSAYRCPRYNALAGGAPLSMHKFGRAHDEARRGRAGEFLEAGATAAGFKGIGRYITFIHKDTGGRRAWGVWKK